MNRNSVGGIIFDLEGTLISSGDALIAGLNKATPRRKYPSQWNGTELRDPITTVMRSRGSHQNLLSAMEDSHITPIPGVSDVLESLSKEYLLAVVSNARKDILQVLLKQGQIAHYFDTIVSIDDVALGKPDPEGIHVACARLGLKPQETVVVGDTDQDAIAAQRAGAKFVLAQWGKQAVNSLCSTSVKKPNELETLFKSWKNSGNIAALPMV